MTSESKTDRKGAERCPSCWDTGYIVGLIGPDTGKRLPCPRGCGLPYRERQIVQRSDAGESDAGIASSLGVVTERIRQLRLQALTALGRRS